MNLNKSPQPAQQKKSPRQTDQIQRSGAAALAPSGYFKAAQPQPAQPAPPMSAEDLLALAQTAGLELDKVIKIFQMAALAPPAPKSEPISEEVCTRMFEKMRADPRTAPFSNKNWFEAGIFAAEVFHGHSSFANSEQTVTIDRACFERGCACYDSRLDKDAVIVRSAS